jgi:hypothetical protein
MGATVSNQPEISITSSTHWGKVVPVQRVIKFSGSPTTDTMYKQAKTTHKQATYGLEPAATRSPASLVPIYQLVPVYLSHPIIIKMD